MITKYLAHRRTWNIKIATVEVERETKKFILIDGIKHAKESTYENYFDSFDEAKQFLTDYANEKLRTARLALELAQCFAGNVKGLKVEE